MQEKKKQIIFIGFVLLILIMGVSYALFSVTKNGTKEVSIVSGKLELILDDQEGEEIRILD